MFVNTRMEEEIKLAQLCPAKYHAKCWKHIKQEWRQVKEKLKRDRDCEKNIENNFRYW